MNAVTMPTGQHDLLHAEFARLHRISRESPFPPLQQRLEWLKRLESMLQQHRQEFVDAISRDFGHRSGVETRLAELFPSLQAIRYARRRLRRWMRPERRGVSMWFQPAGNSVMPQPLGVIGVLVPWNYPLFLALGPLVSALAAGNRVMVKMSEFTPETGALLQRLAERYLGPEVIAVVNGDADLAQDFTRLPFDHLFFTGSTAVGRHVMRAAAENLTPVTLELGGKSPVIVARGADLRQAAEAIVAGKMLNAGQTCVAPDYVLVNDKDKEALLDELRGAARRAYPTLADNSDYSSIINERHCQRLLQWLEEARAAGAEVEQINPAAEDWRPKRKFPLTLVQACPDDALLLREEIFGPILPVLSYDKFDEALAYVNARPRPLALYLFDNDALRIEKTLRETISGGVAINDIALQVVQDDLPFGGVGPSGMGHCHAKEGFLAFSKLKPVFRQSRWAGTTLTRAPYGAGVERLLKWMLGR